MILASTRCVVGRLASRHSFNECDDSLLDLVGGGGWNIAVLHFLFFSGHLSKHQHSARRRPVLTSASRSVFRVPGETRRRSRTPGSKDPRGWRVEAVDRGQRAVLTRSLHKGTCDVVLMHHGETERPVGMVESLEHRLLLRAVHAARLEGQSLALISSGQQSYVEAIKLFEPAPFPGRGPAIPRKAAWGGAPDGLGVLQIP